MRNYSVKQLAKLSGVSVRTLHHYDEIGLLKPSIRTEARYRLYGEKELLRLQQILFYRELDFPLKDICDILDDPDFDLLEALQSHKVSLSAKRDRIGQLLATVDNTILNLKNEKVMQKPEELYQGLNPETAMQYRREAAKKYGKEAVEQSETALMKLGKAGFERLKSEAEHLSGRLFAMRAQDPASKDVQELIAAHYSLIRRMWGTEQSADKQAEAYSGLGQLYVSDERFTMVGGRPQPEFAAFMSEAMSHFAKTSLG